MKKVLLSLFVVLVCTTAYGQIWQFGARTGAGRSDFRISADLTAPGLGVIEARPGEPQTSFHLGAYTRVKVLGLYVQPELLYTGFKGEMEFFNTVSGDDKEVEIDINRIDIPVMIGIKLGPVRLNADPSFNMLLPSKDDADGAEIIVSSSSFGYQYGIGLDIGDFLIDLKAEGSWSNEIESITDGTSNYDLNGSMHQVLLSIGYRIL